MRAGGPSVVTETLFETSETLNASSTALIARWYAVEKSKPKTFTLSAVPLGDDDSAYTILSDFDFTR